LDIFPGYRRESKTGKGNQGEKESSEGMQGGLGGAGITNNYGREESSYFCQKGRKRRVPRGHFD